VGRHWRNFPQRKGYKEREKKPSGLGINFASGAGGGPSRSLKGRKDPAAPCSGVGTIPNGQKNRGTCGGGISPGVIQNTKGKKKMWNKKGGYVLLGADRKKKKKGLLVKGGTFLGTQVSEENRSRPGGGVDSRAKGEGLLRKHPGSVLEVYVGGGDRGGEGGGERRFPSLGTLGGPRGGKKPLAKLFSKR